MYAARGVGLVVGRDTDEQLAQQIPEVKLEGGDASNEQ